MLTWLQKISQIVSGSGSRSETGLPQCTPLARAFAPEADILGSICLHTNLTTLFRPRAAENQSRLATRALPIRAQYAPLAGRDSRI